MADEIKSKPRTGSKLQRRSAASAAGAPSRASPKKPERLAAEAGTGGKSPRKHPQGRGGKARAKIAANAVVEHVTLLHGTVEETATTPAITPEPSEQHQPRFTGPVSPVYHRQPRPSDEWPYERRAYAEIDGIPVFSRWDAYVNNYVAIAEDHVATFSAAGSNPFAAEWVLDTTEESTARYVQKHTRPGDRILDVGVGPGRLLRRFPQLQRWGLDISLDYLRIAKEQGISPTFSRIEDMPFKDGFFDTVVCTDVLEHVLDLNYCTAQILRVLRPGGCLIVRVPNDQSLAPFVETDVGYEFVHLRKFDLGGLRLHFEKVFDCKFVESESIAPFWMGDHTVSNNFVRDGSKLRTIIASMDDSHPLAMMKAFISHSQDVFRNTLGTLFMTRREEFQEIWDEIIIPLELSAVFVKSR